MNWLKDKNGVMALGAVASVVLDQLTKALIIWRLPADASVPIIPGFFELYHAHNPGASFNLLRGQPVPFFLFTSGLAILFVIYYFVRLDRRELGLAAALSLILGGALGNNLLDRLRHGFVIDFLRIYHGRWSWPTFNVADISIVVGVGIFALTMLRDDARRRQERVAANG
jgi:signal peptidase II